MASMPVRPPKSTKSPLPLRTLLPSTPATAAWPPPSAPTHRTHHDPRHQQEKQDQHVQKLVDARQNVKPFDFSATELPELTYPETIRDYFYPRDEITITENYEPPAPNPLRKASRNPVLFNSPTLRADIAELFGYVSKHHHHAQRLNYSVWQPPPALPYNPEDDDLVAWKKPLEAGMEDEQNVVNGGFDTLPPWNGRFDLEFD